MEKGGQIIDGSAFTGKKIAVYESADMTVHEVQNKSGEYSLIIYTERLLPEELRAVRNSGTLLRDWEEALNWIYIEYNWIAIAETLARETTLRKE